MSAPIATTSARRVFCVLSARSLPYAEKAIESLFARAVEPLWLVLSALLLNLYPLMFMVWHGDPMEIPRHAVQIGIQFRLAGWIAVLLFLDHLFTGFRMRAWLGLGAAPASPPAPNLK